MNQQTSQTVIKNAVIFPNGNKAQLLTAPLETDPEQIINTLDINPPKAVIMLAGGAGLMEKDLAYPLHQLFDKGVIPIAQKAGALVIDGGTQSGVMEIMGQSIAEQGHQTQLLGIAPAGKVTYPDGPDDSQHDTALDPNHSHFVLVDTVEWGGETDTMYNIAAVLGSEIPAMTILVNGGGIAKQEVLRTVRLGWPVIVIQNSGRLADEIADMWLKKPDVIEDVALAEIINNGNIHLVKLEDSPMKLQKKLNDHLDLDSLTVEDAWRRFAIYDKNAITAQRRFVRLRKWILGLGVVATFLAVVQSIMPTIPILSGITVNSILKYLVIATPIVVSLLVAGSAKFERGVSWVLLRSSAEAIKKEIYRYRTKTEIYSPQNTNKTETREIKLARKVKIIGQRLMKTQVNRDGLEPYDDEILPPPSGTEEDDGFSDLTPEKYLTWRLENQMNWYQSRAVRLDRQSQLLYWSIYILGGLGTFLAAIGLEIWIAVTVALAGALTAFLEFRRIETTLIAYNQAATDLESIRTWWYALPASQKTKHANFEKLVKNTEDVIQSEHAGWVQEMRDALAELYADTKSPEEAEDS